MRLIGLFCIAALLVALVICFRAAPLAAPNADDGAVPVGWCACDLCDCGPDNHHCDCCKATTPARRLAPSACGPH